MKNFVRGAADNVRRVCFCDDNLDGSPKTRRRVAWLQE
jgi:hypothetical protein